MYYVLYEQYHIKEDIVFAPHPTTKFLCLICRQFVHMNMLEQTHACTCSIHCTSLCSWVWAHNRSTLQRLDCHMHTHTPAHIHTYTQHTPAHTHTHTHQCGFKSFLLLTGQLGHKDPLIAPSCVHHWFPAHGNTCIHHAYQHLKCSTTPLQIQHHSTCMSPTGP